MAKKKLDVLKAYSEGLVSQREAIRRLKLRDNAELLVALGEGRALIANAARERN